MWKMSYKRANRANWVPSEVELSSFTLAKGLSATILDTHAPPKSVTICYGDGRIERYTVV